MEESKMKSQRLSGTKELEKQIAQPLPGRKFIRGFVLMLTMLSVSMACEDGLFQNEFKELAPNT